MSHIAIADLSILLVEPSFTQLKVISSQLRNQGIKNIASANTGQEALQKLASFDPDLIISSLYFSDMTATELLTQLRNTEVKQQIPFILISSETKFQIVDPIRQAGIVAVLTKPFSVEELEKALLSTLEFLDPKAIELDHYDIDALRVLVVDDSSLARKHMARVLNNIGIKQITIAKDGKQASEIFSAAEESFDLIVTDLNMPEMDGCELTKYIRSDLHNAFIPILMVTSEQNLNSLNDVEKAGISAICDKPFEPKNVKEILFRIMN